MVNWKHSVPGEKSSCFYLLRKVCDSVCKIKNKDDKYYPQTFSEECQYQEKAKKKKRQIKGK